MIEEANKNLNKNPEDYKNSNDNLVFGIVCLEMDDSMTSIVANSLNINVKSKSTIY